MSVTLPFTEESVPAIAALLDVPARREPYAVRGAAVYRLDVPNVSLGMAVTVLLWPSIRRVDVRIGDCSIVYRAVATVELLPGVEVIFRRAEGEGYLFVSIGGRVSVVA
ncbi:MAG: hypothetical protein ACRDJE_22970 [Dehalococcoidia bacterium]